MRYFSNMTISRMIIMLVVIPVLATGFFAGQTINKEFKQDQVMSELVELVGLSVGLSNLVHEQQKERGASVLFLGSNGEKFKTELAQQRVKTNNFRQKLDDNISNIQPDVHGAKFANSLNQLLAQMDEMMDIRSRVDDLSIE